MSDASRKYRRRSCVLAAIIGLPGAAHAQCINRCGDPSVLQIHTQTNVNISLPEGATADSAMKTTEDARRDLYALSNREFDTLKSIFGGECSLSSINLNSSVQDRESRNNRTAYVSVTSTYQIKRAPKP